MTLSDLLRIRLHNQQLSTSKFKTAQQVMAGMGAIQAQDYAMAKWAIGIRMKDGTDRKIEQALDKGQLLRTHLLRPTWHIVSADTIYWMLALTAPRMKVAMRSRHKELGLSETVVKKSNRLLAKALEQGAHLTREELLSKLQVAKIPTDENRSAHLLFSAELEGIICSGVSKNFKRTYALLESRVPERKNLKKEEALARLAGIYFKSRGPATLADFTWWSGLSITEAKQALELIKPNFSQSTYEAQIYYFVEPSGAKELKHTVQFLPAFDEFLISYKDRTAVIQSQHQKKAFSNNGIFWPTLLVDGKVTGLWKRSVKKDKVFIEMDYFHPHSSSLKVQIQKSAEDFGRFLGKETEIQL